MAARNIPGINEFGGVPGRRLIWAIGFLSVQSGYAEEAFKVLSNVAIERLAVPPQFANWRVGVQAEYLERKGLPRWQGKDQNRASVPILTEHRATLRELMRLLKKRNGYLHAAVVSDVNRGRFFIRGKEITVEEIADLAVALSEFEAPIRAIARYWRRITA
jgi:hypothetical protein